MAVDQTHPPLYDIKKGDGFGYARLVMIVLIMVMMALLKIVMMTMLMVSVMLLVKYFLQMHVGIK